MSNRCNRLRIGTGLDASSSHFVETQTPNQFARQIRHHDLPFSELRQKLCPLSLDQSESQYRARQDLALGSQRVGDMDNATPTTNESHVGVRKNRQPPQTKLHSSGSRPPRRAGSCPWVQPGSSCGCDTLWRRRSQNAAVLAELAAARLPQAKARSGAASRREGAHRLVF